MLMRLDRDVTSRLIRNQNKLIGLRIGIDLNR